MLLRVPGIGVNSARRITQARRHGNLKFDDLKKIGVVLKRALYFITCNGKMMYPTKLEEDYITRNLVDRKEKLPFDSLMISRQLYGIRQWGNRWKKFILSVKIPSKEFLQQYTMPIC